MVRSLRWRLQAWHALTLLVVVTGFGAALYFELRRARFDEIDAELVAGARMLEGVLRNLPEGPIGEGPGDAPFLDPPPDRRPPPLPPPPRGPGRGGPPRGFFPPPGFPPRPPPRPRAPRPPVRFNGRLARALSLPTTLVDRYSDEGRPPYFLVRDADGAILAASLNESGEPPDLDDDLDGEGPRDYRTRQRGWLREVVLRGPRETRILVGRRIDRELGGLRRLAWQLALTGLTVFGGGLVGGWWLSSRAIRPIAAMSATVAGITSTSLARRLDLEGVDTELGQLGSIVNDMLHRLETSFEQQARFTADASHELRTPLAVILTNIELALTRPRPAESYRETLETCARAAGRMKSLVDDLLTLARADTGKLELKAGRVDLAGVVTECVSMLEPLAARTGVRLRVDLAPAVLVGDPDRLGRVVTNLVTNALTYNRLGGEVRVATVVDGDVAVLTVVDTGVGILADDLPFLFDRFYRVDRARARDSGGSGLGLAICKSVVEAHGGTIAVESAPGKGSTFQVRLPTHPPESGLA